MVTIPRSTSSCIFVKLYMVFCGLSFWMKLAILLQKNGWPSKSHPIFRVLRANQCLARYLDFHLEFVRKSSKKDFHNLGRNRFWWICGFEMTFPFGLLYSHMTVMVKWLFALGCEVRHLMGNRKAGQDSRMWYHHVKRSLKAWVGVIRKEGWTRVRRGILLLVWHWLLEKERKKNFKEK